jgi:flagellar protein FliL
MAKAPEEREPEAPEQPAEAAPKKSKPLMKYAIIAGVLVVQTVLAYFLQKTFLFPGTATATVAESKAESEEPKDGGNEAEPNIVMLDEIVVNPAETGGRRYLAVTVGLQMKDEAAAKSVEKATPLIRDALITLLSAKHLDELSRASYRDTLRTEIKTAVNVQMKNKVEGVVFSGYVLQ